MGSKLQLNDCIPTHPVVVRHGVPIVIQRTAR
jgi:hypothetical protein